MTGPEPIRRALPLDQIGMPLPARIVSVLREPADEGELGLEWKVNEFVHACYSVGLNFEETVLLAQWHAPTAAWLAENSPSSGPDGSHDAILREHVEAQRAMASLLVKHNHLRSPDLTLRWDVAFQDTSTPQAWTVTGFVPAGESVSLLGAPKVGKSVFTLEMAVAKAYGLPFLGMANGAGRVLYLDWENRPRELVKRLTKMGYGPGDLDNLFYSSFPDFHGGLETEEAAARALSFILEVDPELVVVDTLQRAMEGDESSSITIRQFYKNFLLPLRQRGIAVVRLDHTGKDPSRGSRGSSAKYDDVDQAWSLRARSDGLLDLRRTHSRTEQGASAFVLKRPAFLRHEVVADAPDLDDKESGTGFSATELVEILADLDVPLRAGRPTCAAALKTAKIAFKTEVLAAAVKQRKEGSEGGT